ncbi:TonB-dependent receptor [Algoriphagus sp. AK58]|uniref:TonB-dependent receptor n=1 Tax=Algoriphagus sp. AK58 TaxID=1406877 RepID=UPI00165019E5|nr:TonB-dependent receptor [Algoriphagus sp. AK58]
MNRKLVPLLMFVGMICSSLSAQSLLKGEVKSQKGEGLELVQVLIKETGKGTLTDSLGRFELAIPSTERVTLQFSRLGFQSFSKVLETGEKELSITLSAMDNQLDEVVVSGTLQEVSRLDSPVPVEVYKSSFFRSNPAPSLFESFQNINGVRPQVNCNICNTGDIQINGLAGPYTMILIDGMPIVSGLATVYGLSGIPQALIDRIEVVKGPASTLYGSEAVGGLINIITKRPENAPLVSFDAFGTTWGELNLDLGIKSSFGKKIQSLTGVNTFWYDNPIDNNQDGMTDLTLQKRFSVFQKLQITQKKGNLLSLAGRYIHEDRWGGQMSWTPAFRGGDVIYGESIRTQRWEFFGNYQLPVKEQINFQFSANGHKQDSYYGDVFYGADQRIGFGQLTWNKLLGKNQLLAGAAYRLTYYDDSTPATAESNGQGNSPFITHLPGLFLQNELKLSKTQSLLGGIRYDYNTVHGSIWSPRLNYKISSEDKSLIWRTSIGNGFRVANVFTEDHAALTGARQVVFEEELDPERSWNVNTNLVKKIYSDQGNYFGLEGSVFYTQFSNQIIPDYETNPNQIIYANLDGTSRSQGLSFNFDGLWANGFKLLTGITLMDVSLEENGVRERQLFTERFSGVWTIGYHIHPLELTIDYTGNVYSPMRLPLLGELDDRPEYSPWWSLQNIQITKGLGEKWEIYGGVKNLLNYTPPANSIARAFDPFDRGVAFDGAGNVVPTPENPNALTFDPTYMFAPNQGIRGFFGVRYTWN